MAKRSVPEVPVLIVELVTADDIDAASIARAVVAVLTQTPQSLAQPDANATATRRGKAA